MTAADKVTSIRLILAPVFFVVYLMPTWLLSVHIALSALWTIPVLWLLFIVSELTDLFDGRVARARNEVSDFGKLYDPFADTLARITYFLCFVVDGVLPSMLLVVVLYREFGISFIRTLMMKKGIAMGARSGGKLKAVFYMIAGGFALIAHSVKVLGFSDDIFNCVRWTAIGIFAVSVVLSLTSFSDYYRLFKKAEADSSK